MKTKLMMAVAMFAACFMMVSCGNAKKQSQSAEQVATVLHSALIHLTKSETSALPQSTTHTESNFFNGSLGFSLSITNKLQSDGFSR